MPMACPAATARPPVADHESEVGSDAGFESACERTPCPHCFLGVRHAANLAEAMTNWQERVWDYSSTMTVPDEGYWMRLMAAQWIYPGQHQIKMRPGFTIGHQAWIHLAAGQVTRFGRWNKIIKRERGGQWAMLFPGTLKNVTRVVLQQQQ